MVSNFFYQKNNFIYYIRLEELGCIIDVGCSNAKSYNLSSRCHVYLYPRGLLDFVKDENNFVQKFEVEVDVH